MISHTTRDSFCLPAPAQRRPRVLDLSHRRRQRHRDNQSVHFYRGHYWAQRSAHPQCTRRHFETGLTGAGLGIFPQVSPTTLPTAFLITTVLRGASYGISWERSSTARRSPPTSSSSRRAAPPSFALVQLFSDTGIMSLASAPAWFFHSAGAHGTSASITGSISGATLDVTAVSSGIIAVGQTITGTGIASNTTIIGFVSGTNGGVGTYTVSNSLTSAGSETF